MNMWRHNKPVRILIFWLISGNWLCMELEIGLLWVTSTLGIYTFHLNQTKPGACKYYVYNQSKAGWISSILIQMGYICWLVTFWFIWLLLVWHDMESRLIWCRNFSNDPGKAAVINTEVEGNSPTKVKVVVWRFEGYISYLL